MKKILLVGVVVFLGLGGWFWWRNLRGAMPAVGKPAKDIVRMFEERAGFGDLTGEDEGEELAPGKNSTDFPLKLTDGFEIEIFAKGLVNPRVLALDPHGVVVASLTSQGRIVALPDINNDGAADRVVDLISGLDRPHGLAFHCEGRCQLYVAESGGIDLFDYDELNFTLFNRKRIIDLPNGGRHFSRTLVITPGNKLLISVGSSCDTCVESDWRRAGILIADLDGSNLREYATGLRNSVFMDYRIGTDELWATEMGRDFLGDDLPPDEINIIEDGKDYGWPYCYGKNVHDDLFDKSRVARCKNAVASHIDLQAHSAPLGLEFVNNKWPKQFQGDLLVSYHGSWNRSVPTGYKIERFDLDEDGNELGRDDFISGWLDNEGSLGRPVDLIMNDEGSLFVSDDKAGVIYRIFPIK